MTQSAPRPAPPGTRRPGARLGVKYRFDDADMDLFFVIACGWGRAGGLDIGEAFYVAETIRDGDAPTWVAAFEASGDRQQALAEEWRAASWKRQSAQARLKAFASYRSAWQFAPIGPVFDGLYAKHKAAFRSAIPDLGFDATFFDTPYKGKSLPGLFIQNTDQSAPVVLLLGGADTCFEEIFLTAGRNVHEQGYSVAMVDLPGQGLTMKDGLHWEAETEKPIGAVIDGLIERFGAKPGRIAMLGIPTEETALDLNRIVFNMLTLKGIYGREMYETWYAMTVMLQSGLDVSPVITHRFAASAFEEAFATAASGRAGKVILDWEQL